MGKKEIAEDLCPNCGKSLGLHSKEEVDACQHQWQGEMELEPYDYGA